jgi:hypothetical protein
MKPKNKMKKKNVILKKKLNSKLTQPLNQFKLTLTL